MGLTELKVENKNDEKIEIETKLPQMDELSASEADDDFDDRYIHLSNSYYLLKNFSCCSL